MPPRGIRMYARLIVASLAVLLLAGCATVPNPFGTPAVASAPAPKVVGAATSTDPRVASLIGSGDAALKPAAVSAYMDQEEVDLRSQLGGTGVLVTRAGDQIVL